MKVRESEKNNICFFFLSKICCFGFFSFSQVDDLMAERELRIAHCSPGMESLTPLFMLLSSARNMILAEIYDEMMTNPGKKFDFTKLHQDRIKEKLVSAT